MKAKGLLSQILSLPDDWDYSIYVSADAWPDTMDAARIIGISAWRDITKEKPAPFDVDNNGNIEWWDNQTKQIVYAPISAWQNNPARRIGGL